MEHRYPLAWLDETVEVTLNPQKNNVAAVDAAQLECICTQCTGETWQAEQALKAQLFPLSSAIEKQTVVAHYERELRALCQRAAANLQGYFNHQLLTNTGRQVLAALEELHGRICERYRVYLPETPEPCLPAMLFRLLVNMSGDQLSIVARAAYQAGLIPAKSLRGAFRLLAPHLSTERRARLSDDSMRTHSGQPENPDLDIVLAHLGKVTEIVKGYYRRRR
jgi:hypothetical protein